VSYHVTDIRDYSLDKHDKVDKAPYGGGPGMVIQCQPVWDAVRAVEAQQPAAPPTRILLTPQGVPLTQKLVEQLATRPRLLLIAGHYEGLDERVIEALDQEGGLMQISIGDYVLSGGEIAAMALIDAVVRLLPGVLGDDTSTHHESFSSDLGGGLDYPHYTRPPEWRGRTVPDVLLSGHHAQIEAWRREQSKLRTAQRRPDLAYRNIQDEPQRHRDTEKE
jgi:tRNA (guanine37-N1)-methyltransferase